MHRYIHACTCMYTHVRGHAPCSACSEVPGLMISHASFYNVIFKHVVHLAYIYSMLSSYMYMYIYTDSCMHV